MITIDEADVADAMHLTSPAEFPAGVQSDIRAAETLVENQVQPYADDETMVGQCAVYVAAAFIAGTDGDLTVERVSRESQTIAFDTDTASPEAVSFWERAKAFDPTGRLGENVASGSGFFEVY